MSSFFLPRKKKSKPSHTPATTIQTTSLSSSVRSDVDNESVARKSTAEERMPFPTSKQWKESDCGTLLYLYPCKINYSAKIAGFDIDGTVIRTKSGKAFATNDLTDWKLWSEMNNSKSTFAKLSSEGYRFVFFTNQEGISKGKVNKEQWMKKIENLIETLELQDKVTVLASLVKSGNDYRKPHTGMWNFLCQHLSLDDLNLQPDTSQSFYVGDAAGRPKRGTVRKDFSCTDYKFALNIGGGLKFMTPEQLFYKSKNPSDMASFSTSNMGFQPQKHWSLCLHSPIAEGSPIMENFLSSCLNKEQEVIVFVGSPASGKSNVALHLINQQNSVSSTKSNPTVEYVRVNQDTLKTFTKCIQSSKQAIADGKSVVIDNTNRDIKTRQEYISLAKAYDIPCRCLWMKTTKEESFHLNALRAANGNLNGTDMRSVPDMAIHSFYKNMVVPTAKEGFDEVIEYPFVPGPFLSIERKDAFFRFTR